MYFFCSRTAQNVSSLLLPWGADQVIGRPRGRKRTGVGGRWKDEDDAVFFIYIPVSAVGLASKKDRPKLLAIHPRCHSVTYFHSLNS